MLLTSRQLRRILPDSDDPVIIAFGALELDITSAGKIGQRIVINVDPTALLNAIDEIAKRVGR